MNVIGASVLFSSMRLNSATIEQGNGKSALYAWAFFMHIQHTDSSLHYFFLPSSRQFFRQPVIHSVSQ